MIKHQSQIAQVFIKPMSLPWVVVTDPWESQDILLRRTKEFDRASFFGEVLGGLLPEQYVKFLSDDRRLTGAWDDGDVAAFRPERWLVGEAFDRLAGPSLAFGLGPRVCFGRRLAVAALRIQFAMTVWRFELLGCPERLGGCEAVQEFAREPLRCYVRLAAAGL